MKNLAESFPSISIIATQFSDAVQDDGRMKEAQDKFCVVLHTCFLQSFRPNFFNHPPPLQRSAVEGECGSETLHPGVRTAIETPLNAALVLVDRESIFSEYIFEM